MITLTQAARDYLEENLNNSPHGSVGIRIGLRDAGCSGFAYTIDYTTECNQQDEIFKFDGVNIIIDQKFLPSLRGTEIDYVTQGVNSILQFNNPNVVNQCGCGESFQFRDEK